MTIRADRAGCRDVNARFAPEKAINLDDHWMMLLDISRTIEFPPCSSSRNPPASPRRGFQFGGRGGLWRRLGWRAARLSADLSEWIRPELKQLAEAIRMPAGPFRPI